MTGPDMRHGTTTHGPAEYGIPPLPRPRPRGREVRWRREQLMAAGYDELSAHRMAADGMTDVHAMVVRKERCLLHGAAAGEGAVGRRAR